MKHSRLLAKQLGAPLRRKHWLFLADLLRFAQNDLAYNHPQKIPCEAVDKHIEALKAAENLAREYLKIAK